MQMADGSFTAIEDLGFGDMVLAGDPTTGETSAQPVLAPIVGQGTKHLVVITVAGNSTPLVATAKHPIWVDGDGWTDAADLTAGDQVRTSAGGFAAVREVVDLGELDNETVFNLHVAGPHTYFVGRHPILVHNAACPIHTGPEIAEQARKLGYSLHKGNGRSMEMDVFRKGQSYITHDRTHHKDLGYWKKSKSPKFLRHEQGTWNKNLTQWLKGKR